MIKFWVTCVIIIAAGWTNLTAQNPLDLFKSEIDTSYIKTYPKALTLKAFSNSKFIRFNISGENNTEIKYQPNGSSTLGFGFNYKWIGLGIDFKIVDQESRIRYGESSYYDIQLQFNLRHGTFDLFLQNYEGFYIRNSAAVIRNWPEDTYMKRPDVRVFSSGANYTHILNPQRFSYRAAFLQTEAQRKSAGSIIMSGGINYHEINADSSLIPDNLIYAQDGAGGDFNRINAITTTARFGYAHTFVAIHRFFLTISADAGLSYGYIRVNPAGQQEADHQLSLQSNVSSRFALGYNHGRWYAGMNTLYYIQVYRARSIENTVGIEYGKINFTVAYRLMLEKEIDLPEL